MVEKTSETKTKQPKAVKFMTKEEVLEAMVIENKEDDSPIKLKVKREYFGDLDFDIRFRQLSKALKEAGYDAAPKSDSKNKALDFYFAQDKDQIVIIQHPTKGNIRMRAADLQNAL